MRKFSQERQADLHRENVKFFHAKEHWNRQSPAYNGLSNTRRKRLLSRLVSHIHKFTQVALSVAVNPEEYKAMTTERFRSEFGGCYAIAIQLLVVLIWIELKKRDSAHEKANIFIEDGGHIKQALQLIEKTKGHQFAHVHVSTVSPVGKIANPIVQAADMIAYGWSQYLETRESAFLWHIASGKHEMLGILPWKPELIQQLQDGVSREIFRRNYERLPHLDRGLKPLLRNPQLDD